MAGETIYVIDTSSLGAIREIERVGKMSIASACGLHQIISLRVEPFLVDQGLLDYRGRGN